MLTYGKNYMQSVRDRPAKSVAFMLLLVFAFSMFIIGRWSSPTPVLMQAEIAEMQLEIVRQKQMLNQLAVEHQTNIDALAVRLAELKAASTRLDALGERLVTLGQLDPQEFDFNQPPPVGGPESLITGNQSSSIDLSRSISLLSAALNSQYARLDALQLLLLDRKLENARTPAGWPVSSGWISSGFGERTDPFSGKAVRHDGLDFAGVKGSEVLGVASGVVTWSGPRAGYGKLLEINHGNGYITRYAHNEELLVKVGEAVTVGQVIAKMGKTGRATSPHVHFEVLYKDKAINPYQFVKEMR
jgi:murein DD-endopeptidase MepM/ murein hydrolase activator NlpD